VEGRMIDFSCLSFHDLSPIYQQIVRHVKLGLISGMIMKGEEMPSRRILSAQLSVNPNTIQKAYRIMEEEGLIMSFAGSKSIICCNEKKVEQIKEELVTRESLQFIETVKHMGFDLCSTTNLISKLWGGDEGDER
jgi:DNA-binding transcriptional regulator YhcF (GntR family)